MDFSFICRLCLGKENISPIFENNSAYNKMSEIILTTTGVKVFPTDGLPQNICKTCKEFTSKSIEFRNKCNSNQLKLNSIKLNDFNTEFEEKNVTLSLNNDKHLGNNVGFFSMSWKDDDHTTETKNDQMVKDIDIKVELEETFDDNYLTVCDQSPQNNHDEVKKEDSSNIKPNRSSTKKDRVTCSLCQKDLSIRSLDNHMTRHHPAAVSKIQCELCSKLVSPSRMNRHIVKQHGKNATKCRYCKSDYETKEVLIKHVNNCTARKKPRRIGQSSRELQECDICHMKMQKASLKKHKAVTHAGIRPVCQHCGRNFGNKNRLNEHCRAKHGYEKLKCSYCDFVCASVMALRNHERRHRNEKPFVCDTCGAKFHAAYLLAQHKQSHRTEKHYKCDQCPGTFKTSNSLHMHKMTCHGSYLYKCHLCPRTFRCRHYAVKHLRHMHNYKGPVPQLQKMPNDENEVDQEIS